MSGQPIDIRPDHGVMVRDILVARLPKGVRVWVFGSRAKWLAKPYSDLDLALEGDGILPDTLISDLKDEFTESDLPWKVDVLDLNAIAPPFRAMIDEDRVGFSLGGKVMDGPTARLDHRESTAVYVSKASWRKKSVYDLAIWKNGLAFKNIDFSTSGRPVIKIAEMKNGVTDKTARTVAEYDPSVFVQFGDMLFSWSGNPDTSIDVFRWGGEDGWLNQHIFKVTPQRDVSEEFLFFTLRWLRPRFAEIARNKQTTGLGHVTIQDLKRMTVGLPDFDEQNSIVEILGPLERKIDLNRRMNETLEAMARAIFRDWFVDFGPTRAKMAASGSCEGAKNSQTCTAPYLAPEIWDLFPDRLGEDGVPVGWVEKPLSEFFSIIGGGTPKTKFGEYWNGNIPWFSVVDAPQDGNVFILNTEKSITKRGLDESSSRLIREGTTIISARGTVGKLAMAGQDMTFNQSCYGLQKIDDVGDCFTFLAAQHMVARLQSMAHGSVFSTITRATFDAISLAMPLRGALQEFENISSSIFARIKANGENARTLAQTRDLLLPKLMSGEVRVNHEQVMQ